MFELTNTNIEISKLTSDIQDDRAGAIATFEGRIRNHNQGREVDNLTYEVYETLALSLGSKIIEEAITKFNLLHAKAVHRHGFLEIGEVAVWVGVSSPHRKEAFAACQFIIDEIKHQLPIWKKENYSDGTYEWVNCSACTSSNNVEPKSLQVSGRVE